MIYLTIILLLISPILVFADTCTPDVKLIDPKNIQIVNDNVKNINIDEIIAQRKILQDQIDAINIQLQSYKALGADVPSGK